MASQSSASPAASWQFQEACESCGSGLSRRRHGASQRHQHHRVAWLLGVLSLATQVEFSEETQADRGFGTDGMPDLLPHALGIVSAAEERFNFHSAGSGSVGVAARPAQEAGVPEARLKRLEDSFKDVQKSLASLTEMLAGPKAPAESSKDRRAVASGRLQDLDPAVVASARATGIPDQHLQEMAKILGKGPGKLEDCPRPRTE